MKKYIEDNMDFTLFAFTNENLKSYIPLMEVYNKDVLTVVGSGDQALNLILEGARSVDTFDINPLAKKYLDLKIAAILSLSYEEFKMFLVDNTISYKRYKEFYTYVRKLLTFESKKYFDNYLEETYEALNGSWECFLPHKNKFYNNLYAEEAKYKELKSKLTYVQINFINSNLLTLPSKLDKNKRYQAILCSNIKSYLPLNYLMYEIFIRKQLLPFVHEEGIIQHMYYYNKKIPILKSNDVQYASILPGYGMGTDDCVGFIKKITR